MNKFSGTGSKVEGGEDLTCIATEVSKDKQLVQTKEWLN